MKSNQLHVDEMAFDCPVQDLDLRTLQLGFSDLFDRAAQALQRLGLDTDDVVFDRILVCRTSAAQVDVRADWLSDKERLLAHIGACLRRDDSSGALTADSPAPRVTALKVIVRSEPLPMREFPCSDHPLP